MRLPSFFLACFVAHSAFQASTATAASTVAIEKVDLVGGIGNDIHGVKGLPGKHRLTRSQEQQMHIHVKNIGDAAADVSVRYWFIGRNLGTNRTFPVAGSEETVSLGARGTRESHKELVSLKTDSHYQEAGMNRVVHGQKKLLNSQSDAGIKIVGYVVQVVKDDTVLSEAFSSQDLKAVVGSHGNKPGKPFQKKADHH